jgi:hypothetical protein
MLRFPLENNPFSCSRETVDGGLGQLLKGSVGLKQLTKFQLGLFATNLHGTLTDVAEQKKVGEAKAPMYSVHP